MSILVNIYPSLINKDDRTQETKEWQLGNKINDYIPDRFSESQNIYAIHNGRIVEQKDFNLFYVNDKDELTFTIRPKGIVGTFLLYNVAIPLVIGTISNALQGRPQKKSSPVRSSGDFAESPTYGWDGVQTISQNGAVIPVVYGKHRVGGNIIQIFSRAPEVRSTTIGNSELFMLIALGEGEIENIEGLTTVSGVAVSGTSGTSLVAASGATLASGIQINSNRGANFKNVTFDSRLGHKDQTIINNFRESVTSVNQNKTISVASGAVVITTTANIESYELNLKFNSGLYTVGNDGSIASKQVSLTVKEGISPVSDWGAITGTTFTIDARARNAFTKTYRKENLTSGIYDIQITRNTPDDTGNDVSVVVLDTSNQITTDDLAYPNLALLGVKALATDQLSNATPNVTCMVKGKKLRMATVSGSNFVWSQSWTDNPAWVVYDILTNKVYGLGDYVDECKFDYQSFIDFADFCDELVSDGNGGTEKRCTCNLVLDSQISGWEAIHNIMSTARATLIKSGNTIRVKIEKAETATQLFSLGNIKEDSYSIGFKSIRDDVNFIEVQYLNENKNYEQDVVSLEEASISQTGPFRKESISAYGVTRKSQALRIAQFRLNVDKNIIRTLEFEASVEALVAEVGDVINIQHDVSNYGMAGGRVASATPTDVTIDQSVTLSPTTDYRIRIKHLADNTIETKNIVPGTSGTLTTLPIVGSFTLTPSKYDIFAFGVSGSEIKSFRIVGLSRSSEFDIKIKAVEYNSAIYTDDPGTVTAETFFKLPDPNVLPADVTDLALNEVVLTQKDGSVQPGIEVGFNMPLSSAAPEFEIWYKESTFANYIALGTVKQINNDGYFLINQNLSIGKTYDVAVVAVSKFGSKKNVNDAPSASVTLDGKTDRPPNVTGFSVVRVSDTLHFFWDAIDKSVTTDLDGYEIRVGESWGTGIVLAKLTQTTQYSTTNFSTGPQIFMIRSRNTSGIFSLKTNNFWMDVANRIKENVVFTRDERALNWPGTITNLITRTTTGETHLNTGGFSSGTYEVTGINVGKVYKAKVYINFKALQVYKLRSWINSNFAWNSTTAQNANWSGDLTDIGASTSLLEARFYKDSGDKPNYETFVAGEREFQYVDIRATIYTSNYVNFTTSLRDIILIVDVEDVTDNSDENGLVMDTNPKTVSFASDFLRAPAVNANIIANQQAGDFLKITSITQDDFVLSIVDSSDVLKSATPNRTIAWTARGQ